MCSIFRCWRSYCHSPFNMYACNLDPHCVSVKESEAEGKPAFGISFVDTATGQFHLTQFRDDVEMTNFETFIAQTGPQELLLEKSSVSTQAMRILKNNTGPTTLWNHLKPGKEFWTADITSRELDANGFLVIRWWSFESGTSSVAVNSRALVQCLRNSLEVCQQCHPSSTMTYPFFSSETRSVNPVVSRTPSSYSFWRKPVQRPRRSNTIL